MQKKKDFTSTRLVELKKRKRRVLRNRIILFACILVLVVGVLGYFSRTDAVQIQSIEITGNRVVDREDILGIAERETTGHYLWIFPKANIFITPQKSIKKNLLKDLTRLEDVSIRIKDSEILDIEVTERTGLYTWCGSVPEELSSSTEYKCYFLDKTGYLFDEAPYFYGNVYFKFYGEMSVRDDGIPQGHFMEKDFLNYVTFRDNLVQIGLDPVAMHVTREDTINVYLSAKEAGVPQPLLMLNRGADFKKVIENLNSILTTEPFQTQFREDYSKLLYIDLRFGNKVFYKFQENVI